jgi:hypothetical protein
MNTAKVRFAHVCRCNIDQGAIQKWQCREADNLGYTRRNKTKQKHNTMYVGNHYGRNLNKDTLEIHKAYVVIICIDNM